MTARDDLVGVLLDAPFVSEERAARMLDAFRDEMLRKEAARIYTEADARYEQHRHEYNAAEVYRPEGMRIAADLINPDVP